MCFIIYFPLEAVSNVIFLNTWGGGGERSLNVFYDNVFYECTKIAGFYDSWVVNVCSAYMEEDVLLKYRKNSCQKLLSFQAAWKYALSRKDPEMIL